MGVRTGLEPASTERPHVLPLSIKRPHVYHIWFPIGVRTADMADRGRIELPSWESKSHVLTVELSVYN